jgi:hypothetical protein
MTGEEIGTTETRIAVASRDEARALAAFHAACKRDDDWQAFYGGLEQLAAVRSGTNGSKTDPQAVHKAEAVASDPSPAQPVSEAEASDSQSDALSTKTPQKPPFPEGSCCQSAVVSESSVQPEIDVKPEADRGKSKKQSEAKKTIAPAVAPPPVPVDQPIPAPVDDRNELVCVGFHDNGQPRYRRRSTLSPITMVRVTEPEKWPDGSPKRSFPV